MKCKIKRRDCTFYLEVRRILGEKYERGPSQHPQREAQIIGFELESGKLILITSPCALAKTSLVIIRMNCAQLAIFFQFEFLVILLLIVSVQSASLFLRAFCRTLLLLLLVVPRLLIKSGQSLLLYSSEHQVRPAHNSD